ncbi:MAG: PilZ domain-containing protein [Myxococcales bacterium]|nr:PilZ domain-containing protein [Myxococcales bacterium]
MDSRAAALLKYRFGTFLQMQRHLHVVEGRTLFFYRDPRMASFTGASRVVMEFSFADSEQATTMRGAVLSRLDGEGGQTGAWIEFPDAKLARKLDQGMKAFVGRHQRRIGCDMMVEIKVRGMPYLGRMIDVAMNGARVTGAAGMRAGTDAEMRIMGAEPPMPGVLGRVKVVRADPGGDVGVTFVRSDVIARVASSKLYTAVQQAWTRAPEVQHPVQCCQNGHVLEPPLPHMKTRT